MTREQAEIEYKKIMKNSLDRESEIVKDAKKKGIWKMGLDSNNELFQELYEETWRKISVLKTMVDE